MSGGQGSDTLTGGPGDDVYLFRPATAKQTDIVSELAREGRDRLDFSGVTVAVTVDLTKDPQQPGHSKEPHGPHRRGIGGP